MLDLTPDLIISSWVWWYYLIKKKKLGKKLSAGLWRKTGRVSKLVESPLFWILVSSRSNRMSSFGTCAGRSTKLFLNNLNCRLCIKHFPKDIKTALAPCRSETSPCCRERPTCINNFFSLPKLLVGTLQRHFCLPLILQFIGPLSQSKVCSLARIPAAQ